MTFILTLGALKNLCGFRTVLEMHTIISKAFKKYLAVLFQEVLKIIL